MNKNNVNSLKWGSLYVSGAVVCLEKKVDVNVQTKPTLPLPTGVKQLQAGHKCKEPTYVITERSNDKITKRIDLLKQA